MNDVLRTQRDNDIVGKQVKEKKHDCKEHGAVPRRKLGN